MIATKAVVRLALSILVLGSPTLLGCGRHPYYVVQLTARADEEIQEQAKVTFDRSVAPPQHPRFALIAPKPCENIDARGGSSRSTEGCATQLAKLEAAIVARGSSVVSWRAIHESVAAGRAATATEAARRLGATVLLEVDLLEESKVPLYSSITSTIRETSTRAEIGPPASVPRDRKRTLNDATESIVESLAHQTRNQASLHVTAVLVDSGRAAWFYEWRKVDPVDNREVTVNSYFLCNRRVLTRCLTRTLKDETSTSIITPSDATTVFKSPELERAASANMGRLLDEVFQDMLDQLSRWTNP